MPRTHVIAPAPPSFSSPPSYRQVSGAAGPLALSGCNGDHFVRWPEFRSAAAGTQVSPTWHRRTDACERRDEAKEMRGRWRWGLGVGADLCCAGETKNICLHMQRCSRDRAHIQACVRPRRQGEHTYGSAPAGKSQTLSGERNDIKMNKKKRFWYPSPRPSSCKASRYLF